MPQIFPYGEISWLDTPIVQTENFSAVVLNPDLKLI